MAQTAFDFSDKVDPYDYVSSLAGEMHSFERKDVLRGPFVPLAKADERVNELIRQAIESVNTTQFNVFVSAPGKNIYIFFCFFLIIFDN